MANLEEQPIESDLVLVASLSGEDVHALDSAILREVRRTWSDARLVVSGAHAAMKKTLPYVPAAFFSHRLRKLVAAGCVEAEGSVDRKLDYQVRAAGSAPTP